MLHVVDSAAHQTHWNRNPERRVEIPLREKIDSEDEMTAHKSTQNRLEIPEPQVIWVGNKTILRNYAEYPKLMRRDPDRLLMYLAKELATAASLDADRAIFIGRKDKTSFAQLFQRYMVDNVTCPVCGSPDTHIVTESRLHFRVCEACGARSSARVN
jgi:translation initiation factor 2 subunit 2